ncbi:MAG: hypothetical protein KBI47_12225 [Armatimonadetes bacterium]|nr:hypothetical protein [Armatimonadota bacterium]
MDERRADAGLLPPAAELVPDDVEVVVVEAAELLALIVDEMSDASLREQLASVLMSGVSTRRRPRACWRGGGETFTINRLGLTPRLRRCLATTNVIESPTAGVRLRTRRVTNWRNGQMVPRWAGGVPGDEKSFLRIFGYRDLWALKAVLDEDHASEEVMVA